MFVKEIICFLLLMSQTAGAFYINMKEMNIDVLCFTGHKSMYAPQGVGALCVKENIYIKPLLTGGSGTRCYDEFHLIKCLQDLKQGL